MQGDAVSVRGLVKVYSGGVRALEGIDLSVRHGEIFGLIGPNGAGKSTTIRILATLLKPTDGSVSIMGRDVASEQMDVRGLISYLPEDSGAYESLSGREYLRFMSGFYEGDRAAMVERGTRIAELGERIDNKVKEYSKGMKRRLQIGRALMTAPRLAILDEPTAGLDVMHGHYVRHEVKRAIREDGSTAIISSHNLLEVEFLCDRVGLIDRGRILDIGTPAELKRKYSAPNLEEVFLEVVGGA
jgi:ABC-2 type transport system ATP-binding protein